MADFFKKLTNSAHRIALARFLQGKNKKCKLNSLQIRRHRQIIIIFEINLSDTCTRFEKYSSKLDIFRSFVRIFASNRGLKDTFTIKSRHRNHDKRI